jgi:hypothetical protein
MVGAVHKAKSVPGIRENRWNFRVETKVTLPKNASWML